MARALAWFVEQGRATVVFEILGGGLLASTALGCLIGSLLHGMEVRTARPPVALTGRARVEDIRPRGRRAPAEQVQPA